MGMLPYLGKVHIDCTLATRGTIDGWWAQGGGTIETKERAEPECIAAVRFGSKKRDLLHHTASSCTAPCELGHLTYLTYAMLCHAASCSTMPCDLLVPMSVNALHPAL